MRKCFNFAAVVRAAFVITVLGSAPLFCEAQVIGSFENNLSSPVGATWEGLGASPPNYVSVGATDGSSALEIHHSTGWAAQLALKGGMQLAQQAATHDFLLIDATTKDNGVGGDGWSPNWRQVFAIFNSNQGGWQQKQLEVSVAPDGGGSLTTTLVLDLNEVLNAAADPDSVKVNAQAFVNAGPGDGTYFELFLAMQGGDQGSPVKAGDYSSNSIVSAPDYVTWRNGGALANETASPGVTDVADYAEWKAHFGTDYSLITTIIDNVRFANAGAGSSSLSAGGVPEPSSVVLAMAFGLVVSACRRPRS